MGGSSRAGVALGNVPLGGGLAKRGRFQRPARWGRRRLFSPPPPLPVPSQGLRPFHPTRGSAPAPRRGLRPLHPTRGSAPAPRRACAPHPSGLRPCTPQGLRPAPRRGLCPLHPPGAPPLPAPEGPRPCAPVPSQDPAPPPTTTPPPATAPAAPLPTSPPVLPLCRTAKFWVGFCTHTAHDGGPGRGDSLGGVISAIACGGTVASALRPVCADHLRSRAADAGRRGRDGVERAPRTPCTPWMHLARRAASHPGVVSRMADNPPLISPCGIASEQTGDPGPWRRAAGEETVLHVLPSTSRNGARQEPEDNADQAGRSQGRAAREGGAGR